MKRPAAVTKPSQKTLARPASKLVNRQAWQMVFASPREANNACRELTKTNHASAFCKAGTAPMSRDNRVLLQWHMPAKHYSVHLYFVRHRQMRSKFGPGGTSWTLEPWVDEESARDPMPETYKFDKCQIWSSAARAHLEDKGYVIATGFVPSSLTAAAFLDVDTHLSAVLQAFGLPAVQTMQDISKVPVQSWTYVSTRKPPSFNHFASEQAWGVSTSIGYMRTLGNGQALSPKVMCKHQSVVSCQLYPKTLIGHLLDLDPEALCWQREYVSVKTVDSGVAPLHKDTHDDGRLQAVVMLSNGSVVGCPKSHRLPSAPSDLLGGSHYHTTASFQELVASNTPPVEMNLESGDVYIFKGGSFVHGCPVATSKEAVRMVTYASFWPPGTKRGNDHAAIKCMCPRHCGVE